MTEKMAAAIQATLSATVIGQRQAENALRIRKKKNTFALHHRLTTTPSPSSGVSRITVAAASKSPNDGANLNANDPTPQDDDDVGFLLKLVVGSIAGAAAIKYGSILVPEITRPNITQALAMIFTPVIAAVLILIKQSRVQQ